VGKLEPYEIRVLGGNDFELMRGLLDCFGEGFGDRETYCSSQPDDHYLATLLSSECFFAVAAIAYDRVIGGLAGYELHKFEQPRSELYIYDLAVRELHRRRGIATALIDQVKSMARSRGAWVIYVQADLGDDPAIALYSGLGSREDVLHFDISPE
jgi:aminoglycoside 3-N-acetyltransferase I